MGRKLGVKLGLGVPDALGVEGSLVVSFYEDFRVTERVASDVAGALGVCVSVSRSAL
jgi:hypothetical protein